MLTRPLVIAIGVSTDIASNSDTTDYFVPESPTVMVKATAELDVLQVNLETATSDDAAAILSLRDTVAAWLAIRGVDLRRSPLQPERLIGWIDEQRVLVQRGGSRIVGTITLLERDEHIWNGDTTPATYVHLLTVDRAYAGQDLGGRMLKVAEAIARERGAHVVRLDAGSDLEDLQGWYALHGYDEVITRTEVGGPDSFVVTLREKSL